MTVIIPLVSTFFHWDEHWFVGLPGHPLYKSLEVMIRGRGGRGVVCACFTRREGSQSQICYVNDERLAAHWPGEAFYRYIQYDTHDNTGRGETLRIEFLDADNQVVSWFVTAGTSSCGAPAGLSDRSTHADAEMFVLLFRETVVEAAMSRLTLGSVTFEHDEQRPNYSTMVPPLFSSNIYMAMIAFENTTFVPEHGHMLDSKGRRYFVVPTRKSQKQDRWTAGTIHLMTTSEGELLQQRQYHGDHVFTIGFDPPMSSVRPPKRFCCRFTMSFDSYTDLVEGDLTVLGLDERCRLTWRPNHPAWAVGCSFTSLLFQENGKRMLCVRRGAQPGAPYLELLP